MRDWWRGEGDAYGRKMESSELTLGSWLPSVDTPLSLLTQQILAQLHVRPGEIAFLKGMHTHTYTHLNICVSMKTPMGHTHSPYPALTSRRRETTTQTHIITLTSEREDKGENKCTGAGRQTASMILLQWSAAVSRFFSTLCLIGASEVKLVYIIACSNQLWNVCIVLINAK